MFVTYEGFQHGGGPNGVPGKYEKRHEGMHTHARHAFGFAGQVSANTKVCESQPFCCCLRSMVIELATYNETAIQIVSTQRQRGHQHDTCGKGEPLGLTASQV
jgi:hypothetical protein